QPDPRPDPAAGRQLDRRRLCGRRPRHAAVQGHPGLQRAQDQHHLLGVLSLGRGRQPARHRVRVGAPRLGAQDFADGGLPRRRDHPGQCPGRHRIAHRLGGLPLRQQPHQRGRRHQRAQHLLRRQSPAAAHLGRAAALRLLRTSGMTRSFTAPFRSLLLAALVAAGATACSEPAVDDPLLWLEEPHGAEALQWAREATAFAREELGAGPRQATIRKELEHLLQAAPTEPDVHLLGPRAVRLQRDAAHPYGLLQAAALDAGGQPGEWRTVLDVAELREREGVPFELQAYDLGSACLAPGYSRCLLRLSPAGGDEVELREFDLEQAGFVDGGFRVPKSRAFAHWLDADTVLVMHALDGAPTTLPGWPASARVWKRGEPLSSARVVFEGQASDALLQATVVGGGDAARAVITRAIDYSTFETWLVGAGG